MLCLLGIGGTAWSPLLETPLFGTGGKGFSSLSGTDGNGFSSLDPESCTCRCGISYLLGTGGGASLLEGTGGGSRFPLDGDGIPLSGLLGSGGGAYSLPCNGGCASSFWISGTGLPRGNTGLVFPRTIKGGGGPELFLKGICCGNSCVWSPIEGAVCRRG